MANINWQNLPSETTPINSTNLNVMSAGLVNVSNEVDDTYRVNVLHSKNLLPNNGSTITTNGITFTKNSDGSLTINGTASGGRADYYLFGGSSDNGNYLKIKKGTYSFNRSNLTDGTMFVAFREKTAGSKYETTTNNSAIETMASQDCYFYGVMIGVENGKTINNLTIYPMLNEGSTLLDYEPYKVPSIYVDNEMLVSKNVYSTSEVVIGEWLGKPLYRKVIEITNPTLDAWATVNHNIANMDFGRIVDATITRTIYGTTSFIPIGVSNISAGTLFTCDLQKTIFEYKIAGYTNITKLTAVLEYTKTTD